MPRIPLAPGARRDLELPAQERPAKRETVIRHGAKILWQGQVGQPDDERVVDGACAAGRGRSHADAPFRLPGQRWTPNRPAVLRQRAAVRRRTAATGSGWCGNDSAVI